MGYVIQGRGVFQQYTPSWTGFSVEPTGTARYTMLTPTTCMVIIRPSASGTSNATTKTVTLPFNAKNGLLQVGYCYTQNNGANGHGTVRTRLGSNVADIYLTGTTGVTFGTWTNSGNCTANFVLIYEIE